MDGSELAHGVRRLGVRIPSGALTTRCGTPVSAHSVILRGASTSIAVAGAAFGESHMTLALLHGLDDVSGHLLPGDVDEEPDPVEALEGLARRPVIVGFGEHFGGYRTQLDERRAKR